MLEASGYILSAILLVVSVIAIKDRNNCAEAMKQMSKHYSQQLRKNAHEADYLRDELQKEQFKKENL